MNTTEYIPQLVSQAVRQIDPQAAVILFGSRARGEARPDSDWDFLILLPTQIKTALKQAIRDRLWEIEIQEETLINSLIFSTMDWKTKEGWPIYDEVKKEGIIL